MEVAYWRRQKANPDVHSFLLQGQGLILDSHNGHRTGQLEQWMILANKSHRMRWELRYVFYKCFYDCLLGALPLTRCEWKQRPSPSRLLGVRYENNYTTKRSCWRHEVLALFPTLAPSIQDDRVVEEQPRYLEWVLSVLTAGPELWGLKPHWVARTLQRSARGPCMSGCLLCEYTSIVENIQSARRGMESKGASHFP